MQAVIGLAFLFHSLVYDSSTRSTFSTVCPQWYNHGGVRRTHFLTNNVGQPEARLLLPNRLADIWHPINNPFRTSLKRSYLLLLALVLTLPVKGQSSILADEQVRTALAGIETNYAQYVDLQITISEIPAPPFGEHERAVFMRDQFRSRGITSAHIDSEGNVIALRPGSIDRTLVVSAHLDTVWPLEDDVTVKRDGARLMGLGISDDAAGLVSLLGLLDALEAGDFNTESHILFVATVGEEGIGDLRGVKYLFREGSYANKIDAFISVDGAGGDRVVNGATASKRYKITVIGPGGHSSGAFGIVNPAHALGNIISHFAATAVPVEPKTTYSIGRIGGGISVNTIPDSVWMEVDMRSKEVATLAELEKTFLSAVDMGVNQENVFRSASGTQLEVDKKVIGDRPTGTTSEESAIYRAGFQSSVLVGGEPFSGTSSTDSNIPMSLGIPAVTISAGGLGGGAHNVDEWYDSTDAHIGLQRLLLMVLLFDQYSSVE